MSSYEEDSQLAIDLSPREDSPESPPFSGHSEYGDSGVVVNGGLHNNAHTSLAPLTSRNGPRRAAAHSSPLTEVRRSSLPFVDMSGNGNGLTHVPPAEELEMMYAFHAGNAGRRNSQPSTEAGEESNGLAQQSSFSASQEMLPRPPKTVKCFSPNWWNPKFSSPILERHLKKKVIEFLRRRFRIAVLFIALSSLLWIVFFSVHLAFDPPRTAEESEERVNDLAADSVQFTWWYVVGGAVLFVAVLIMLALTYSDYYGRLALLLSTTLTILLMLASVALSFALYFDSNVEGFSAMWLVAQFSITGVVTLVIFTLSQLPILFSAGLCIVYLIISNALSITFTVVLNSETYPPSFFGPSAVGTLLFYCALILIGCSTAFVSQKRQHATFWKIAQCVLSQKAMDLERELEEKMILSILPQPFAQRMMSVDVQLSYMMKQSVGGAVYNDTGFTISQLDRVTILFADIVDFTEFSSSLSAEELVGILNELFSMFDDLVVRHKCEKISTLGDCYFCVSGCPEPVSSHANNCVDLGLAIVESLEVFRRRTGHPLDMRIGIHTGSVLCGVMGTRRFKFDVWSKDVTIANQIEACSTPGRVMISAATKHFLSSAYVVEPAHLQNQDPDLAGIDLFYVVGRRHRALSHGTSVKEWRRRLSTIDTVAQALPVTQDEEGNSKMDLSLCCFWHKKRTLADPQLPPSGSQSSSSIAEIFTMQTQLQKCTSYAELANPEVQQQSIMDHKIVELMKEQKVDFDTYFDPQLRVLTLQFHNHDWENAYRNYGRNLDDGSSGEMMETELGYRLTKQSYMCDTVTLFLVFLLIMFGSLAVLCGGGTFSLWPSWLSIFLIGLILETIIIIHVWAVYQPQRFPARFAAYAQFIINWYVRSFVAIFMIYYPMTIVYASIGQCTGDVIENTQDLAAVQMAFFVTIVVLISSITFMEVSHFVKLIGGLLSAIATIVMVMTLHLQICIGDINIDTNTTASTSSDPTVATQISYETDPPDQYLRNYYHRHVAPEAVILLLLILLILAVVNRMSEVSVRLSFIGRIEAAGRRRYTRQQKTQAEWLLFNIIPPRVTYELRRLGRYSRNHDCVGVAFVSIANFNEFHRRTSEIQGEAPYCILNQIISEFDLLLEKQFECIEKIKTIGSVYMAASGLDTEGPDITHLLELIDFAQQMFAVMEGLNTQFRNEEFSALQMRDFSFQLKVGFNYGPVTSGVVGSRKMLYDIWGDTVNVASRMNTTGMVNKIHMPESCLAKLLESRDIRFERHDEVHVKGKGAMKTVFVSHVLQPIP